LAFNRIITLVLARTPADCVNTSGLADVYQLEPFVLTSYGAGGVTVILPVKFAPDVTIICEPDVLHSFE